MFDLAAVLEMTCLLLGSFNCNHLISIIKCGDLVEALSV